MEASHCLDTKKLDIIRKVQSVSSTSTEKHSSEQSSVRWAGGSEEEKQIEKKLSSSSQTTRTRNSNHIETVNSGRFYYCLSVGCCLSNINNFTVKL